MFLSRLELGSREKEEKLERKRVYSVEQDKQTRPNRKRTHSI